VLHAGPDNLPRSAYLQVIGTFSCVYGLFCRLSSAFVPFGVGTEEVVVKARKFVLHSFFISLRIISAVPLSGGPLLEQFFVHFLLDFPRRVHPRQCFYYLDKEEKHPVVASSEAIIGQ
jgi:hypothetical protein